LPELDNILETQRFAHESAGPAPSGPLAAWRYRVAVTQHHGGVYRMARALLGNGAEAEDVTQETFIRYWQQGAGVRRPREWLMKVARNACLDRLRKAGRFVSDDNGELVERPDDHDPAWHYEQRELAAQLKSAIETLTEPQRSLVLLFDVQGMSVSECARVVGLNVNQVKVYLHRARRRLRLKLEESK
jgi:RNA polymerase sigma-70 factor, ECF subfamily